MSVINFSKTLFVIIDCVKLFNKMLSGVCWHVVFEAKPAAVFTPAPQNHETTPHFLIFTVSVWSKYVVNVLHFRALWRKSSRLLWWNFTKHWSLPGPALPWSPGKHSLTHFHYLQHVSVFAWNFCSIFFICRGMNSLGCCLNGHL